MSKSELGKRNSGPIIALAGVLMGRKNFLGNAVWKWNRRKQSVEENKLGLSLRNMSMTSVS